MLPFRKTMLHTGARRNVDRLELTLWPVIFRLV
jgi:hypothetical protein